MEQLSLPIPSLQFLAAHAVVRRMVLMKTDEAYWCTNHKDSLRECEQRIDKLPLPPPHREYVRNVLRGFFIQIKQWVLHGCENPGADILVDARGNLDERRTIRHHFQKRSKDQFYREDFQRFVLFLENLSWYNPHCCSRDFVSIIANLQEVYTFLEGPEYRIVGEFLHVVFRFVNRHRVPSAFNALLEWKRRPLTITMEQTDVLLTYSVPEGYYDEDLFRIHVDLLQPLQRLQFVKELLYWRTRRGLIQRVIRFLNVLDPEMRRDSILFLNEDHFATVPFLECCLIPGYESLFIRLLKLVGLNLHWERHFRLLDVIVDKIDLIGYDSLLFQFWQHLPASAKTMFHTIIKYHKIIWTNYVSPAMETLSQNRALFEVLFDNVSASPPKKKARHAL